MTIKVNYLENLTYSATDDRRVLALLRPNQGVVGSGDMAVIPAIGLGIQIAAGEAVIVGTDEAGQGNYLFESDSITSLTCAAAPSSGHSRISLIVAQVLDQDQDSGGSNLGQIVEVAGASATTGSQVAPTIPPSCIVLASIVIGPSGSISSGNISDVRTWTNSPSGTLTATAATTVSTGGSSDTVITNMTPLSGTLKNGMTRSSNGLLIPAGTPTKPYRVSYQLFWKGVSAAGVTANGQFFAIIYKNGSPVFSSVQSALSTQNASPGNSVEFPLAGGDLVQLAGFQNSGADQASAFTNTPNPGDLTWLSISAVPGS